MVGSYDDVKKIAKSKNWDFVFFSDLPWWRRPLLSNWKFVEIDKTIAKDPTLICRWYKTHPHILFPEYERSIWIDSTIRIKNFSFIDERDKELDENECKISTAPNPYFDSVYEEAQDIVENGKDSKENVEKMIDFLKSKNQPLKEQRYETNFLWRKHKSKRMISFLEDWWFFIENYSKRDQLSINYLLNKHQLNCELFFKTNNSCVRNRVDIIHQTHLHTRMSLKDKLKLSHIKKKLKVILN